MNMISVESLSAAWDEKIVPLKGRSAIVIEELTITDPLRQTFDPGKFIKISPGKEVTIKFIRETKAEWIRVMRYSNTFEDKPKHIEFYVPLLIDSEKLIQRRSLVFVSSKRIKIV